LNGLASAMSPRVGYRREHNFSVRLRKGCGTGHYTLWRADRPVGLRPNCESALIRKAKPFAGALAMRRRSSLIRRALSGSGYSLVSCSASDTAKEAVMHRILVVDDDPMVCKAIEIYLECHGFEVTIADGGEAGLRALEAPVST